MKNLSIHFVKLLDKFEGAHYKWNQANQEIGYMQ